MFADEAIATKVAITSIASNLSNSRPKRLHSWEYCDSQQCHVSR